MAPKPFPFITDGIIPDVPNGFYPAADSDRQAILLRDPGLKEVSYLQDCTELRAAFSWNGYLYFLARRGSESVLWRVAPDGSNAELGTVPTSFTGPAWIKNNPTQLGVCDGVSLYIYTLATGEFVQMSDPAFLGAGGFDYQDTYGMWFKPNSREWFLSNIDDFTGMDSTIFYTKQTQPDNIVGLMSFMRQPLIMGAQTGEWYHNTGGTDTSGNAATFERDPGGLMNYGLGAAKTLNDLGGIAPAWLSDQGQFLMAIGYSPTPISNQMFDREVKTYATFSDANAFVYKYGGHVFCVVNFPTANVTWIYDIVTKLWHKRQSYLDNGSGWGRFRGNCYALLNNKHYVGDYSNGKVYEMSPDYYDDDGHEIQRILYSTFFDGGDKLLFFNPVQLLMAPGIGLEDGTDPQIMLEVSSNTKTWASAGWRSAGLIGEYDRRARWLQLGAGYRRQYRFTFSDKVAWEIWGLDLGA